MSRTRTAIGGWTWGLVLGLSFLAAAVGPGSTWAEERPRQAVAPQALSGSNDVAEPAGEAVALPLAAPYLRTADEQLRLAIRDGYDRSPTFRALVNRLDQHKGTVRVHWAPRLTAGLHACLMHQIVMTPDGGRVLWVLVKHHERSDYLVTLVAHELQHVLEVLEAGVTDGAGMEKLFQRVGERTGSHGRTRTLAVYETAAADSVQDRVKRELRATLPAGRGNAR